MFSIGRMLYGLVAAASVVFLVGLATDAASAKERYALVIANKAYTHTANVEFADRDADAIETALRNVWAVKRRNIRRENNATGNDLKFLFGVEGSRGFLRSLVRGEDSELIVYFAGHGSKENGKPYLLGTDTRPSQLAVTGYSLDLLLSHLDTFQKKHLPQGRVTVILESCFSGRSHVGEHVTGTSAPAFGGPVAVVESMPTVQSNVVVMAAAQGDQYAVWDTEYRQSVFTDALVSGLHGEADDSNFGGNADGKITLGELDRFVSERMGRRLKSVRPGTSQLPEIVGGRTDEVLVTTAAVSRSWREQYRRTRSEELQAGLILSNPNFEEIEGYLGTCLYCPKKAELNAKLEEIEQRNVSCQIEAPISERLVATGTKREIKFFQSTCVCCRRADDLRKRLASLTQPAVAAPTVEERTPPQDEVATRTNPVQQDEAEPDAVANNIPAKRLTRTLQRELKRVGCYTGEVDGHWGKGSRAAQRKFSRYAKRYFTNDEATEQAITEIVKHKARVCPLKCGSREVSRSGKCVAKVCHSGQRLSGAGKCVAVSRKQARRKLDRSKPGATAKKKKAIKKQKVVRKRRETTKVQARKKRLPLCSQICMHGNPDTCPAAQLGKCRR